MTTAISLEQVSKHYRGGQTYRSLRDDVASLASRLRRGRGERPTIKALDDVSFEINEGESIGLIGHNGAGKTTALKLMTRITYPTGGVLRVRGRVGALIEVGSGMHPELTGRENVQLYGRILGFSGRDIRRRFDDIVDFAGIGPAIDQPVKQYSTGMTLRLGFSIASHVEPDVLLVDEALAVGDAGFHYKCVERMSELVREGRTLVFVSHSMTAVETLSDRAILLQEGKVERDGPTRDVIYHYLRSVSAARMATETTAGAAAGDRFEIVSTTLLDASGRDVAAVGSGEPVTVRLRFRAPQPVHGPIFSVGITEGKAGCFAMASMLVDGNIPEVLEGEGHVDCRFGPLPLHPRVYEIYGAVRGREGFGEIVDWQRLRLLEVTGEVEGSGKAAVSQTIADAPVKIPYSWRVEMDGSAASERDE